MPKGNFFDGCHGNNEIHMRTKFYLHMCTIVGKFEKSEEVIFKVNCLRLFVVGCCHGN